MLAVQNIKINSAIIQKDLSVWIVGLASAEPHRWEEGVAVWCPTRTEALGLWDLLRDCWERESLSGSGGLGNLGI